MNSAPTLAQTPKPQERSSPWENRPSMRRSPPPSSPNGRWWRASSSTSMSFSPNKVPMSDIPPDPATDPRSDHGGDHPPVLDLPPLPLSLKQEWLEAETRRHFLARGSKAPARAGLATILRRSAAPPTPHVGGGPRDDPRAKRAAPPRRCGGAAGSTPAVSAEGEACDLSFHGGRALAVRDLGLQAEAGGDVRAESTRVRPGRPGAHRNDRQPGGAPDCAELLQVRPAGKGRQLGLRAVSLDGEGRGRALRHQIPLHRGDQSRARDSHDDDRQHVPGKAVPRIVAGLRPGSNQRGAADIRGDDFEDTREDERAGALEPPMVFRVHVAGILGGGAPLGQ